MAIMRNTFTVDIEEIKNLPKYWVCENCLRELTPRPKGECEVLYSKCNKCLFPISPKGDK